MEEILIEVKKDNGTMAVRLNGELFIVFTALALVIESMSEQLGVSPERVAGLVLSIIEDHKCLGRLEN